MRNVNPEVVKWALDWNGLDVEDLVKSSNWKFLVALLHGGKQPTFKQLEKLSEKTHTIVPYFFDNSVPSVHLSIPDFRTHTKNVAVPSPELFETINEQLTRQGWMSEYFYDIGCDQLEFAGKFDSAHFEEKEVVAYFHDLLGFDRDWVCGVCLDDAVKKMRRALEAQRISVVISGYAKNNTRRVLNAHEFCGFVLFDEYVPVVFLNNNATKIAQFSTMIFGLILLLFSQSGLVDDDSPTNANQKVNRIFAQIVTGLPVLSGGQSWYESSSGKLKSEGKECDKNSFYNTCGLKLGTVFTDAIFTAVKSMYLSYRDAYRLTGLKAKTFDKYFASKGYVL